MPSQLRSQSLVLPGAVAILRDPAKPPHAPHARATLPFSATHCATRDPPAALGRVEVVISFHPLLSGGWKLSFRSTRCPRRKSNNSRGRARADPSEHEHRSPVDVRRYWFSGDRSSSSASTLYRFCAAAYIPLPLARSGCVRLLALADVRLCECASRLKNAPRSLLGDRDMILISNVSTDRDDILHRGRVSCEPYALGRWYEIDELLVRIRRHEMQYQVRVYCVGRS